MKIRKGHARWFRVNCSMVLYQWDGHEWVFTGTAQRKPEGAR